MIKIFGMWQIIDDIVLFLIIAAGAVHGLYAVDSFLVPKSSGHYAETHSFGPETNPGADCLLS